MMKLVALFAFAAVFALAASQNPTATEPMTTEDAPSKTTTTTLPPITNATTTVAPITNATTTVTPITNATTTESPITNATTTESPITNGTTTESPITTPSTNVTTVAPPVTSTETPLPATPPVANFTTGKCIIMKMAARFNVSYTSANVSAFEAFDLSPNTTWLENCGDENTTTVQTLTGTFDDHTFTLTFSLDKDKKTFELSEMDLVFNFRASDAIVTLKASNLTLFSTTEGNSYLCNAEQSQKFDSTNSTVDLSKVQVQAFSADPPKTFSTAQECPADSKTSNIVPIAVGAALAALVVIVLIAYLISRSRNQTGYESV